MRAVILLALVSSALAVPQRSSRIVGGSPTTVEQYPYMTNMQYGFLGSIWFQFCGGSLLTSTAVLSAAHCYEGDRPTDWRVLVGTSYASSGGQAIAVSQIIIHENYQSSTIDSDVAVIRLAYSAIFSESVGVARIPGVNYIVPDGANVTAIGWGALAPGGGAPEQLQHVVVNVINQEICTERYDYLRTQPGFQNWPRITDGMLCAGILNVGGKDACQGDSGGPLAHQGDIVVGVTSWGYSCAHDYYPGVNARVSVYSNWIVANPRVVLTMRAVILLALIGAALAVPQRLSRIVGGTPTTVEQYPYMSNMQYLLYGSLWYQFCGGSLLTSTAVLSAAHCYEGDRPTDWRVLVGTSYASSGGQAIAVSQIIIHNAYQSSTADADVAIIRLANSAIFSDSVGVARIPGVNYIVPDGAVVTAIGWGSLTPGGSYPEQLQHVNINVINQEICTERYDYLRSQPGFQHWPRITDGMLCAGILNVGGKDACQGDSGGPLAHDGDIVVGITSWGYGCAHDYYPGVNTRVSVYSDWIVANAS
ncbi:transmembrane protease serine 9-like [Galleria mellonella]|uniref:Transmembrane protease serine 9-like n=1 Tax=Galleria mellonella TaxID=7137 RepID=A0ABM3MY30_GALME|nr:transmembrane protease serine 9-like [Galleria mellonella]